VVAGRVETPFGPLPANGLGDGQPAQLVIRPEAIHFNGAASAATSAGAMIEEVRFLGAAALVRARLTEGAHRGRLLVARLAGAGMPPAQGEAVRLSIADQGVFVFSGA
jgi:hypothetical protein